jgi:CheY-like chemotaxis protein
MPRRPILVVDDDPENLRLARLVLQPLGLPIATAASAEAAWTRIRRSRPRLVLTDVQLPGMSGLELAERIKAHPSTCRIPVVAVSGSASKRDRDQARAAGCDAFVAKPINARSFPRAVARLLAD